tara:strand:+ start:451 stop:1443 length:993 start_codon:yes stop_codon:yes gene_type:complete
MNIGINGFGRIGRLVLRNIVERNGLNVVAINDLFPAEYLAYLLKYDSTHGKLNAIIEHDKKNLIIDGQKIRVTSEKDPSKINWGEIGAEYVIESSGIFLTSALAKKHLSAGAKKVILSAPAKDDTPTFVMGVNHNDYKKEFDIVSNASCTTNCLAPIIEILDRNFGVDSGIMSTIHAVTATQKSIDSPSLKNWRLGRGAYQNIIPSSTGAAKAVEKVLPSIKGKLTGMSFRVPTANVSAVDLSVNLKTETSYKEICKMMLNESRSLRYKNVLGYTNEEVVSSDFMSDSRTSIFDAKAGIELNPTFFKIISWYDNEWGYSNKLIDLLEHIK